MKPLKLFILFLVFEFYLPIGVFAAQEGKPSFLSSLPILPLFILFLFLIAGGIFIYIKYKEDKKTPYNLPSSPPQEPFSSQSSETSYSPVTKNAQLPVASFSEIPSPPPSPKTASLSPKSSFSKSFLIGLTSFLLLTTLFVGAYFLRKKPKILEVGQPCQNDQQCGTGQKCVDNVCKITPEGDGPGGCCSPGLSAENGGCRDWEACDISNGACSSNLSCRDKTGGQPVQCGVTDLQCIDNCANRQGEEKCYNGKIYTCGNDCCFHKKTPEQDCQASPSPTPGGGSGACAGKSPGFYCQGNGDGNGSVDVLNCTSETKNFTCQTNHTRFTTTAQCNTASKTDEWTGYSTLVVPPGESRSCQIGAEGTCDISQVDIFPSGGTPSDFLCWDIIKNCTNCGTTPTPSPTIRATPTPTRIITPTLTPSPTPTRTVTPSPTPTGRLTPTPTPTPTRIATPTPTQGPCEFYFGYVKDAVKPGNPGIAGAKVTAHRIDNTAGTCLGGHIGCTTATTDSKGYFQVYCNGSLACLGVYETENAPGYVDSNKPPTGPTGSTAWSVNTIVWNNPSTTICGPFIFYDMESSIPLCRGIRVLTYKDGSWQDLTTHERNNLSSGVTIRIALPVRSGAVDATKAAFKITINSVVDLQEETTNTMLISGNSYYFIETVTKIPSGNSADYNIAGWLFINGNWY